MQRVKANNPNILQWEHGYNRGSVIFGVGALLVGVILVVISNFYYGVGRNEMGTPSDVGIGMGVFGIGLVIVGPLAAMWRACLVIDRDKKALSYSRGFLKLQYRTTNDLRQYSSVCVRRTIVRRRDGDSWTSYFAYPITFEGTRKPIRFVVPHDYANRVETLYLAEEIAAFLGCQIVDDSSGTEIVVRDAIDVGKPLRVLRSKDALDMQLPSAPKRMRSTFDTKGDEFTVEISRKAAHSTTATQVTCSPKLLRVTEKRLWRKPHVCEIKADDVVEIRVVLEADGDPHVEVRAAANNVAKFGEGIPEEELRWISAVLTKILLVSSTGSDEQNSDTDVSGQVGVIR